MPEGDATGAPGAETQTTEEPTVEARLAAIEAENTALRRDQAFRNVLPPDVVDTPVGQFFAQNYQGELGPAAVRAEAIRLGLVPDPAANTDPAAQAGTATAEERAAHEQARDMSIGGVPAGSEPGPHPKALAREAAEAVRQAGGERGEQLGAYFASAVSSAAGGDRRGTIDLSRQYFGSGRQPTGV